MEIHCRVQNKMTRDKDIQVRAVKAELLLGIVFYSVISKNSVYCFLTSRGTAKENNVKLIS
jgi:hypothetical protein